MLTTKPPCPPRENMQYTVNYVSPNVNVARVFRAEIGQLAEFNDWISRLEAIKLDEIHEVLLSIH